MKRNAKISLGILVGATLTEALTVFGLYKSVFHDSRTFEASSVSFATLAEKLKPLRDHGYLLSSVEAVEYDMVIHDNGFAPSDWDVRLIAKVRPQDIPAWIGKRTLSAEPADLNNLTAIVAKNPQLHFTGTPATYRFPNDSRSFVAVFKKESLIAVVDRTL